MRVGYDRTPEQRGVGALVLVNGDEHANPEMCHPNRQAGLIAVQQHELLVCQPVDVCAPKNVPSGGPTSSLPFRREASHILLPGNTAERLGISLRERRLPSDVCQSLAD